MSTEQMLIALEISKLSEDFVECRPLNRIEMKNLPGLPLKRSD